MAEGIKKNERSGREAYPDIFNLPHWTSPTRPRMSLYDRSAQFASYKALSGYEDMVAEEARMTGAKPELEEYELDLLDQKLGLIEDMIRYGEKPTVTIAHFVPDELKAGGAIVEITDTVKRIDNVARKVVLMSKRDSGINNTIDIDKIVAINSGLVDYLDDTMEVFL